MTRQKSVDKKLLYVFLSVPLLSSIMSAIHLINMVSLGNPMAMAVALAVTFELGSIVSFIALSKNILKRLKKEMLYVIFVILFLLQAFGNVYSSFDYIRQSLIADPLWLDSFREMFFNAMDVTTTKLTLAVLIGLPIPIISLVLLKSAIDYFSVTDNDPLPEVDDNGPKGHAIEYDNRGNIKGAKTYAHPADISGSKSLVRQENEAIARSKEITDRLIAKSADSKSYIQELATQPELANQEAVIESKDHKPEIAPILQEESSDQPVASIEEVQNFVAAGKVPPVVNKAPQGRVITMERIEDGNFTKDITTVTEPAPPVSEKAEPEKKS